MQDGYCGDEDNGQTSASATPDKQRGIISHAYPFSFSIGKNL
jgi:hypothetical protein